MNLPSKVEKLERQVAANSETTLCEVSYKAGQGPADPVMMPTRKALDEALTGRVKRIDFPLTFNEKQAERAAGRKELASLFEEVFDGVKRDTEEATEKLVLCSRPVIMAKQIPPKGRIGGYFATLDTGEEFHQSNYRELLKRRKAGFVIVQDYDESKEPWYNNTWNMKGE